jgi:uncharacterized protein (DUF983 family)
VTTPPADGTGARPDAAATQADPADRVSPARALLRGLGCRCAHCGSGHIFASYFRLRERCPRCGLRFQRHEGQWSGDIGINTVATTALLFVVLLGGTLLMWNHLNAALLLGVAAVAAIVFPIAFIPVAKSLWVAIDLVMRPVEPSELRPGPAPSAAGEPDRDADDPVDPAAGA